MPIEPLQPSRGDLSRPRLLEPPRMRPLPLLPVFLPLAGRRTVVIGGTPGAAWKAELLAAAGANVAVYAAEASSDMGSVLAREPRIRHVVRAWTAADLVDAALVVADVNTDDEAESLRSCASLLGVPLNVVDRPSFCDVQFGSIVNRAPVVVGISTDGAAPVLAQAIRRKIETILPPALADWAGLAKRLRARVNVLLRSAGGRRLFWEQLAERAFRAPPADDAETQLLNEAARMPSHAAVGSVTLVGAGPGDADLLTIKAVRALQAADVILFDDLVTDEILELGRREARRVLVGKRGGRESCRQDDINATMIALAKAGKRVVRLKAGDPMVFGRAGEEIAALSAEGIAVDVVPGITAALAMAATLGVSLTHREHARSVRFITAHGREGDLPTDIDWAAVADPRSTTVFYMGGRMTPKLVDKLLHQGLSVNTPVAICRSVSRQREAVWRGRLVDLDRGMASIGLEEPVLIGVGAVFAGVQAQAESSEGRTHDEHRGFAIGALS